ncbi:MAG TPA: PAS domain-containing hybrid sensor histidine kinase/response regulator [Steroidobacteraceae bacterium]|jgi:PAS domain S-box-containing protein|nr:PAS domain-containing hybrid sensor histidine kinase/response regulator [Steroidobacteraceae bacterium]
MLSGWLLSALAVTYLGFLFAIAFYGDRRSIYPNRQRLRPYIYGLALGVYCTSWTFYGAVGTAVREGWGYLPIYVGPALVYLLALPFLERLVEVGRAHKVGSIADFIASRFGKSRSLAVLVTLIAVTAATPYLALQYKAVAASIEALTTAAAGPAPWYHDSALTVALLMALFAVLFGARRVDATEHHEGLMLAIAFESLLKLMAFVAVGLFAWLELKGRPFELPARLQSASTMFNGNAFVATLLAAAAIFCLPRQFQVSVIECADSGDVKRARWILPLYLGMFSVFAVPIVALAVSGSHAVSAGSDTLMLTLPLNYGAPWLAVLVFLGGLSAATAMVVVASIALATMISNDIAVPLLWHRRLEAGASLGRRILWLRRFVIVVLALLAFAYYRSTSGSTSLASIGMLSFAAVAQFAPGILAALYWGGASRAGVFWGMFAGFAVWGYLLFLPNLIAGGVLPSHAFAPPDALKWLWPRAVADYSSLGIAGPVALASLTLNVLILVMSSLLRGVTLQERRAARVFTAPKRPTITAKVGDLEAVAARIIGPVAARRLLDEYAAQSARPPAKPSDAVDRGMLQHVERVLAGSIGASSARIVLTHALKRKGLDVDEVAELLDETSQELRFSRQLLAATMENVTQGISVVDADMNLVAWNHRYLELFDYPSDLVYVGRPVADLIRWNAQRGEFGVGDPEQQVAKRLAHMRAGTAYTFQRERKNGQVFSIYGQPMAGGGFVSTYTDITEFKRTEQALLDAKQELEARVEQRTQELRDALEAQRAAKLQAEAANHGKTRFVAAASHDLLQPLNAARLFVSALESRAAAHPELVELASRIDGSMRAAEELLKDLLDVAQLDIGVMRPDITTFSIAELLDDLRRQYAPLALSRRLRLKVVSCRESVRSDRVLLRRILQNYLSNGLRYCERGGVLIGCRRRAAELEICVYDTGPGIASHQREHLYVAFSRLEQGSPWGEKGLGLGLSICDRLAGLLNHELTLSSQPGHGSVFGVRVPRVAQARRPERHRPPIAPPDPAGLREFNVLVVDNDLIILDAMQALLEQWGIRVFKAHGSSEALRLIGSELIDAVLADYHLGDGSNGLELIQRIAAIRGPGAAALITADHGAELTRAARRASVPLLHKPLRPAALRALLSAFKLRLTRGSAA